ncbi:hypothetical protein CHUAL_014036 [Chamberlinius hualienensis]
MESCFYNLIFIVVNQGVFKKEDEKKMEFDLVHLVPRFVDFAFAIVKCILLTKKQTYIHIYFKEKRFVNIFQNYKNNRHRFGVRMYVFYFFSRFFYYCYQLSFYFGFSNENEEKRQSG